MTGSVSNRWMRVVAMAAPMSVVWLVFILHGSPWAGLGWIALAFSAVLWPGTGSTRSLTHVIDDIEAEPVPATSTPLRATPAPKAVAGR